jgi:hypothetical protein
MMKKVVSISFILLLLGIANPVFAQITKIRGTVVDSNTKQPLPYVNVSFKGTSVGTITSDAGDFFIETRTAGDSLSISYVGYTPLQVKIKKGAYQELRIELDPESIELAGVMLSQARASRVR